MIPFVKKTLLCVGLIGTDFLYGAKSFVSGGASSGTRHKTLTTGESLAYIERVYVDYLHYGGLRPQDLAGKRVLEIGPGDNYGVALRFIADGAAQVTCCDRFRVRRDTSRQNAIYEALYATLSSEQRRTLGDDFRDIAARLPSQDPRLRVVDEVAVEDAAKKITGTKFDLIVSRAVMEHVGDVATAFSSMAALLSKGGVLLHKIDLRDHGMFSARGFPDLEFLTLPDSLYRFMSVRSGRPNRARLSDYLRILGELGFDSQIFVSRLAGVAAEMLPHVPLVLLPKAVSDVSRREVARVRSRLTKRFASHPDEDLMVTGFFLVARH